MAEQEGEAQAQRALHLLGQPKAFARMDEDKAVVFAQPRGVTLRIGSVPSVALQMWLSNGAVRQEAGGAAPRFVLTEAGQARLRRMAAGADGFAAQHAPRETMSAPDDSHDRVEINAAESPLLWLYRRGGGLLGDAEFAAGERLRSDMTIARTLPRLTADLSRPSRTGMAMGLDPSEARVAASQRVTAALRAVGPELSGVLMDVCGFLKGLDMVERERGWPQRSAKLVLCLALAALARHYGLANVAVGKAGGRRRHAWGAADARPAFPLDVSAVAPAHPT